MLNSRENRISEIIKEAYVNVPFYKHLLDERKLDLKKLTLGNAPKVNKVDMLISDYVNVNVNLHTNPEEIISMLTSGTMGEPFDVKWRVKDERKSLLQLWLYRKKYYNISPEDKLCYFFPGYIEEIDTISDKNCLAFSRKCIYDGTLSSVYEQILIYNPRWMILQPSMALALCKVAEDMQTIPDDLEYIECTGEELSDAIRKKIRSVFKCKIANQYGCKEVGSIAYECPYGNLHCMDNSVITEIDKDTDDIYVTSLDNYIMPFIRYCTGDKGCIEYNESCKCKNLAPIIKLIGSRKNEYILLRKGKMHLYVLTQIIDKINYIMNNCIIQYRITQNDYDIFLFELVIEEKNYDEQVKYLICKNMRERFDINLKITFEIYRSYMQDENKEKHRIFLCNIKDKGV